MARVDAMVCSACFANPGLVSFVESVGINGQCDFCGVDNPGVFVTDVLKVASYIRKCLLEEYDDPANWMHHDSQEGGFQGETIETYDLLSRVDLALPNDDGPLFDALAGGIDQILWCRRDPYGLSAERATELSWERFCRTTKHERRFFFHIESDKHDDEILTPAQTLNVIMAHAKSVGLFRYLPKGSTVYRARHTREPLAVMSPSDLGPPPQELSVRSNRMSPAGVVMMYASLDAETAIAEVHRDAGHYTVGAFRLLRPAAVLDLTSLPEIPELFDSIPDIYEFKPRPVLQFLHHVADEISRPLTPGLEEHVEYVPTQIVTEFLRLHATHNERPLDGIVYNSARRTGHSSIVLFATHENIVGLQSPQMSRPSEQWLDLVNRSARQLDAFQPDEVPLNFSGS